MSDDRLSAVLAEGEPELNGFLQRVLDFVQALRRAGVPVALAEGIESIRVLRHLDLIERQQLREGLAAVALDSHRHRRAFDELFELYFPARRVPSQEDEQQRAQDADPDAPFDADQYLQDLLDALAAGGDSAIRQMARQAVEEFGRVQQRDGSVSFFQYKVFRTVDPNQLLEQLLREDGDDEPTDEFQRRLARDEFEARLEIFRQEVEAEIRRRAAEARGIDQVADRMIRPPLEEVDFFRLSGADQAEMRTQIRPLARKLATRVSVKRKHGKDGRLDIRKTVRHSLATGGVPFDPAFKPRKPHKPELYLICDVSGSVASFARFTMMLVHTLQEQFSKVRSFAFVDTLDEVTEYLEAGDFQEGMQRMMREAELIWLDGHSDYGHSFARFHERFANEISPRATVLILGDGRNNYRAANAWVLQDLQQKARHVYWLNPEPIQFWDTGDSIATSYARFCDEMVEVRNLKQLAEFVEKVAT